MSRRRPKKRPRRPYPPKGPGRLFPSMDAEGNACYAEISEAEWAQLQDFLDLCYEDDTP